MRNDKIIKAIKRELLEKYNIKTDKDLIKQLGIEDKDKNKLFAWIRYQCAYSYREGFDDGQNELKEKLVDLLKPSNYAICKDKYGNEIVEGDFVDVQRAGIHEVYKKKDGQLWFNPYPDKFGEQRVSSYFSNDMVKCDKEGNWLGCT